MLNLTKPTVSQTVDLGRPVRSINALTNLLESVSICLREKEANVIIVFPI